MRIPTLKKSSKNFERTVKIDGGINSVVSPMALCENEIIDCSNVIFKDSLLSCRKGFFTDTSMALGVVDSSCKLKTPFKLLDGVFVLEGKECRFGYTVIWDEKSFAFLYTYVVFCDGTHKALNAIRFGNLSDGFFVPETISVFKGKAKTGDGIYLFCRTKNYSATSSEDNHIIYELIFDSNYWNSLFESQCYIPTVFYNGRGNRFFESQAKDDPIYEKPSELEPQNLLTGYFYSYFSTDGCSDSFQLPITDISDKIVTCTFNYSDGKNYIWTIMDSQTETTFLNSKVTASIDRKTGVISFTQNSAPFALPKRENNGANNLKILAYKRITDGISSVVGSTSVINYKSKIIAYGNNIAPNEIFVASSGNPLYFPKGCSCEVGISGERVVAVKAIQDSLAAFTEDSVYSLKLSEGDLIAYCELISGENKSFFKPDKLTSSLINSESGCSFAESVMAIDDKFIFRGRFKIYVMSKSGKMYGISYPVSLDVEQSKFGKNKAVGFVYDGFYGIVIDDKIYLADIRNASIKDSNAETEWYVWQLPPSTDVLGAFCFGEKPTFVFYNTDNAVYYLSVLSGDKDIILNQIEKEYITDEVPITAFFKTSFIDFDKIKVEAVSLEAGAKDNLLIEVDGSNSHCEFDVDFKFEKEQYESRTIKKVTVYPSLMTDKASIKVIGEAPFYINKLKFFYR